MSDGGIATTHGIVCSRCLKPFEAGHICNHDRDNWNEARKREHRCHCDTCYRAHVEGRAA